MIQALLPPIGFMHTLLVTWILKFYTCWISFIVLESLKGDDVSFIDSDFWWWYHSLFAVQGWFDKQHRLQLHCPRYLDCFLPTKEIINLDNCINEFYIHIPTMKHSYTNNMLQRSRLEECSIGMPLSERSGQGQTFLAPLTKRWWILCHWFQCCLHQRQR